MHGKTQSITWVTCKISIFSCKSNRIRAICIGSEIRNSLVNEEFGRYLTQDEAFVFVGKTLKTVKVLHRESNGLTMYVRRLSEGRFQMPHWNDDYKTCSLDYKGFLRLILGEKWESEEDLEVLGKEIKTD